MKAKTVVSVENVNESGLSKEMWDVLKSMTQVNNKTEELKNLVKESTKTKTEIKIATRSLVNIVSNLSRRIDTLKVHYEILLDKVDAQQKPKHDSIQEQGRLPLTKVTSVGVQAEENEIAQEMQHKNAEAISQIECELNEKTGWDGLAKIIDHNWPASCYKNTVTVDRKVIRERKGDVAVVVSPNSPTSGQALEQIKTNFPEALPLLEENLEEGRIEYVKTKTETILSKGSKGETSRVLYMLPYAIDPAGINDLRKLYDTIGQLKEAMAEQNTKKIKLVALGNLDSDYMRKCAEHIYRGTTNMIEIVTNKQISSGKKETQQLEKMVIRSEGKQYADILRTIKSSVDIDKVGMKIKSIKKTIKGDVMLEIQGGADKAEALKRGILNKSQGTRVEMKNKEETFYVTGIDGDVDRQEIENVLRQNVSGSNGEDIRIVSIRPNQHGNQNATVTARTGTAKELLKKAKIKIGWTMCVVRPRVNIVRCFRCLEFGHYKQDCQGEDNKDVCLKCGKRNHRAKDCTGENFCLVCNQEGHRADQTIDAQTSGGLYGKKQSSRQM
ncbi:Zinc knuckle [Popillia japonica]|uniref:Zinc knuckle n=1 Tax=Popillia japonica TaxID=7064 RepID=A0AAW1IYS4_POPJA